MPQLDFIPLAVAQQLKQFENSGGKILWVGQVPHNAEMAANDSAVKALMQKAQTTPLAKVAGTIASSFSPQFDLTFIPGTDTLAVGRFYQKGKPIYLLVNRQQNDITVTAHRQRAKDGSAKIKILDPSNGKIYSVSLPAKLSVKANRAMLLVPDTED